MRWKWQVECLSCGTENHRENPFCLKCGKDLPPEKSMTLVAYCGAVLFLAINILTSYYTSDKSHFCLLYVLVALPLMWTGLRAVNKMGEKSFKIPAVQGPWSNKTNLFIS